MKEELISNITTSTRHNPALYTTQYSESVCIVKCLKNWGLHLG